MQESALYLRCCSGIEIEVFKLYGALSKKINHPESSFILGLAYEHLKHAKVIQGILEHFDLRGIANAPCKKNLAELFDEVSTFSSSLSRINNLSCELSCEILNEFVTLEELLGDVYTSYLQSSAAKFLVEEFSKLVTVNLVNFKKVFDSFVEDKERMRETLIEVIYNLEAKESDQVNHLTPVVKYQNPDSWIHESTLHAFSTTPVSENT